MSANYKVPAVRMSSFSYRAATEIPYELYGIKFEATFFLKSSRHTTTTHYRVLPSDNINSNFYLHQASVLSSVYAQKPSLA